MRACVLLPAAAVLLLTACGGEKPATIEDIQSSEVTFPNGAKIVAENMRKQIDVMRGMMFRESLAPDRGLLMTHSSIANFPYFMYQTKIPLDIIWITRQRRVAEIVENVPPCPSTSARACPSYGGHEKALYVLEVNAGVTKKNGLKVGDVLDF
jgi:uncharacterized membrane protein (UPF0127 family)